MTSTPLARALAAQVSRQPHALALHDLVSGQTLSWEAWWNEARRLSSVLASTGVTRGDRVAVALARNLSFLVYMTACWDAGAVAVPLDPASTEVEMDGFLTHSACAAAITDSAKDVAARVALARGLPVVCGWAGDVAGRAGGAKLDPSPESDALLLYTSGSSGMPKAARLSHVAVLASLHALTAACGLGPRSRILGTLPLFGSHGLFVHGLSPLAHGGRLLLAPQVGAFTARDLWRTAAEHGATFFSTVPAVLSLLLSQGEGTPPPMQIYSASAPMSAELADAFLERFGQRPLNSFGMSEACGWFSYGQVDAPRGSVGRPTACRVHLHAIEGVEGHELWVSGPQITHGYWNNPTANETAFEGEYFRTGDLFRQDSDDWLYCVGRLKRTLHRAGRSLHPEDVEAVLNSLPEVEESVVVGVQHEIYGEVPHAFVVLRPGCSATVNDLFAALRPRLSSFRLPRWLTIVEQLPRLRSGKPDLLTLTVMSASARP